MEGDEFFCSQSHGEKYYSTDYVDEVIHIRMWKGWGKRWGMLVRFSELPRRNSDHGGDAASLAVLGNTHICI